MLYSTVAEYETAITQTQTAISRVLQIGQDHSNESNAGKRSTSEVDLSALRDHLALLTGEKAALEGTGGFGFTMTAGW